ncbi:nucleotidyltransferase domain-containing protein [Candidatus Pacearchaeota archaeon]|nr:nucleotidyltransferase domain-containing protein [Candidatus Pacearchaeota archaeon]
MDKRKSISIIKEFVDNLSKDYAIKKVIFFGSRAVGKPHRDSDIDLIIVSDDFEGVNRIERGASMYNYWPWLIPVDFICYTTKEFNLLRKRISIVKEALENGIIIQ